MKSQALILWSRYFVIVSFNIGNIFSVSSRCVHMQDNEEIEVFIINVIRSGPFISSRVLENRMKRS